MNFKKRFWISLHFVLVFFTSYFLVDLIPKSRVYNLTIFIDSLIPLVSFFVLFYFFSYFFALIPFWIVKKDNELKNLFFTYCGILLISLFFYIFFPVKMERVLLPSDIFSQFLNLWYLYDSPFNNFPSLHVAFGVFSSLFIYNKTRNMWLLPLFVLIIVSPLLVKQHYFVDFLGGAALACFGYYVYKKNYLLRIIV